MEVFIPDKIKKYISDKPYYTDNIGLSDSCVLIFDNMVLKIEEHTDKSYETVRMMQWLENKIPSPKIICCEIHNDKLYTLMSRINGKMACDEYYMEQSDKMVGLLAEGLKALWNIDISDCPRTLPVDYDLNIAQQFVSEKKVDEKKLDLALLKKFGLKKPEEILAWLKTHIPDTEPVLSHGDYCLPNILLENDCISGYIDLGDCAVSDKWKDISMCYISLKNNFSGCFGGRIYPDFNPCILFEKLDIKPDRDKLNYWLLLNELFKLK